MGESAGRDRDDYPNRSGWLGLARLVGADGRGGYALLMGERLRRPLRLHTDRCRIDRPVARTAMSSDAFGLGIVEAVGLRPLLEFPARGEGAEKLIFKGAHQRHGCTRPSKLHDGEESFSRY